MRTEFLAMSIIHSLRLCQSFSLWSPFLPFSIKCCVWFFSAVSMLPTHLSRTHSVFLSVTKDEIAYCHDCCYWALHGYGMLSPLCIPLLYLNTLIYLFLNLKKRYRWCHKNIFLEDGQRTLWSCCSQGDVRWQKESCSLAPNFTSQLTGLYCLTLTGVFRLGCNVFFPSWYAESHTAMREQMGKPFFVPFFSVTSAWDMLMKQLLLLLLFLCQVLNL